MAPAVCYLCGKPIAAQPQTGDHVVPKTLLEGQPPKMRGFEYAGLLPAHKKCNNEFGPESYTQRALELLDALHSPECTASLVC
jgi:5-methylcytosine-specific restriction endonuclease McrA